MGDVADRESLAGAASSSHGKSKRVALPASSSRRKQSKPRPKKQAYNSDDDEDMQLARALSLSLLEGGDNALASSEVDTDAAGSADAPEARPESGDDTDMSGAAYI